MHKPATETTPQPSPGFVEFDERGNSRWVPHEEARTEETLIRMLDVAWLALVPDETPERHRDGHADARRSQRRRAVR